MKTVSISFTLAILINLIFFAIVFSYTEEEWREHVLELAGEYADYSWTCYTDDDRGASEGHPWEDEICYWTQYRTMGTSCGGWSAHQYCDYNCNCDLGTYYSPGVPFAFGTADYIKHIDTFYLYSVDCIVQDYLDGVPSCISCPTRPCRAGPGHHACHYCNNGGTMEISWTTGIDCSGLLCICWHISRTSTLNLLTMFWDVPDRDLDGYNFDDALPGDLFVKIGHVMILDRLRIGLGDALVFEAIGASPYHKVVHRYRTFDELNSGGYTARSKYEPPFSSIPTPPTNELYVYPPTNLTATDEETHIALTWIHSIGSNFPESPVAGYRIYRGLMSARMREIAEVTYVDNYTDFDVVPGRTYYYRVGAFTIEGPGYREYAMVSPYSNEASIAKRVNCPSLLSRKRLKLFPFEFVNNILSQTVIDSINSDIIPIPEEPLKINGNYNLQIKELGYSTDSIDYVQFLHVDRVPEVFSAVDYHNNFFLYDPITFLSPVFAIDQDSNDITYLITEDDSECYNSDSAGYMIITFDLTPHIPHISSALIDANALVKRFEMQCMSVKVKVDTEWVEIGKLPARAFQYKEFVSFSVPAYDSIYIKFEWDNHYKLDCTKLYPNPTLIAPTEIPLVSAVHSSGDTVSNALLVPDLVYVQILSDEYIDLMFSSIAEPDSGIIRDYYFLSYGHYGAMGGRGSGSAVLPMPAPFPDPDVITDQEEGEPPEEEHDYGKRTAEIDMIPKVTSLGEPKPNPFNATIDIPFDVSEEQIVRIAIYDISGKLIDILADKEYEVGRHHLVWDGSSMNSGTYFVKMTAGDYTNTKQIVLIK